MGPYGALLCPIWSLLGPIWFLLGLIWSLLGLIEPYWALLDPIGPYLALTVKQKRDTEGPGSGHLTQVVPEQACAMFSNAQVGREQACPSGS